jgi:hypothetical protein
MHANELQPPMFIAHDPQIPSLQLRRKVKVGSISFLILIRASRTIGPQLNIGQKKNLDMFNLPNEKNMKLIEPTCSSPLHMSEELVCLQVYQDSIGKQQIS